MVYYFVEKEKITYRNNNINVIDLKINSNPWKQICYILVKIIWNKLTNSRNNILQILREFKIFTSKNSKKQTQ